MMTKMLDKLHLEMLGITDDGRQEEGKCYSKLLQSLCENEEKLKAILGKEHLYLLTNYIDKQTKLSDMMALQSYLRGFQMAISMQMDPADSD